MNTVVIDTYKTVQKLQERGFTKDQAEGVLDALTESEIATRTDLKELKLELTNRLYLGLLIHGLAVVGAIIAVSQSL